MLEGAYRSGLSGKARDALHHREEQQPQRAGFSYVFSRMDKLLGYRHVP